MKDTRRATKIYLKHLPPLLAADLIDEYKIPSPQREVLISACIMGKGGFEGVAYLKEKYSIYISYWQFVRILSRGLDMFYNTHVYKGKDYAKFLQ